MYGENDMIYTKLRPTTREYNYNILFYMALGTPGVAS